MTYRPAAAALTPLVAASSKGDDLTIPLILIIFVILVGLLLYVARDEARRERNRPLQMPEPPRRGDGARAPQPGPRPAPEPPASGSRQQLPAPPSPAARGWAGPPPGASDPDGASWGAPRRKP